MENLKEWIYLAIAGLGLDLMGLKSGLMGGFVSLAYEKKRTPRQAAISIASGAVLAGYVGPLAASFFQLQDAVGGVCFLVGLLSMRIVPVLFGFAEEKTKQVLDNITKPKSKSK